MMASRNGMEKEEVTRYLRDAVSKCADQEAINDMRHPDLVNSSISDDDIENYANSSVETEIVPGYAVNDPMLIVQNARTFKPCVPALPPSVDFAMKICSGKPDPQKCSSLIKEKESIPLKFINHLKEKQLHRQMMVKQQEEQEAAILAVKNSIQNLQVHRKKLLQELSQINPTFEKNMEKAKKQLATVERKFNKVESKLSDKISKAGKLSNRRESSLQLLKETELEDEQFCKWMADHSLSFHVIKNNTETGETATVLGVNNINPNNPEETCHVLFESITPGQGKFVVQNVLPNFEEAHIIIKRANDNLDLKQLVRNCVKHWRQQYEERSPNKSIDSTKSGNTSVELF